MKQNQAEILNAEAEKYGRVTKYMALDCEMDVDIDDSNQEHVFNIKKPGYVCKISLVNENGEIVFDTLVDYHQEIPNDESSTLSNSQE